MRNLKLSYIEAKSGLKKAVFPEIFLVSLYRALSPYRGCSHGCVYCDGRAEKYYVEGDFERDIAVRSNLVGIVEQQVQSGFTSREYGAITFGSGVTDVYQPVEQELELTRSLLKALIPTKLPVIILTKSDLVLRDFDLLKEFSHVLIILTITTLDNKLAGILEPGASLPSQRLEVIKKAKECGFDAGVMTMPLCPGLSDNDDVNEMFATLKDAGSDFIYPGGLTLRPGCQKDYFLAAIENNYPHLKDNYTDIYCENRQSGMPVKTYYKNHNDKWQRSLRKLKVSSMIPHFIYKKYLSRVDSVYVLLSHMEELYRLRGVNTASLQKSISYYSIWLKNIRSTARRKRVKVSPLDPFPVTRYLDEQLANEGFFNILRNEKLSHFLTKLSDEDQFFDYPSLKIH